MGAIEAFCALAVAIAVECHKIVDINANAEMESVALVEGIKKWLTEGNFIGAESSHDMWRAFFQYLDAVHQGMRLYKKGLEMFKLVQVIEKSGSRREAQMPSFFGLDSRCKGLRLKFSDLPDRRNTGVAAEDTILKAVEETRLQLLRHKYPGQALATISQTVKHMRDVEKAVGSVLCESASANPYSGGLPTFRPPNPELAQSISRYDGPVPFTV